MHSTLQRTHQQAFQDALLIRMGAPLIETGPLGRPVYLAGGEVKTRTPSALALNNTGAHVLTLAADHLRRVGGPRLRADLPTMKRPELAKLLLSRTLLSRHFAGVYAGDHALALAVSTGDMPGLFADTLNKAVLGHYASARRSWRGWAKQGTLDDYKPGSRVRLDESLALEELPDGAEVEFGTLAEIPSEEITLVRYGRGMKLTREALLNDDLDALGRAAKLLADAAHRIEDTLAYGVLTANAAMADGETLFSTAHANTTTGTLTAANLGTATAKIAAQTNGAGELLDMQAARLIVPSGLKATAEALLDSTAGASLASGEERLSLVSSPHLQANSSTEWFVTTDPQKAAPVEIAFLRGQEEPQTSSRADFDSDGMSIKVVHSVGAKSIDYRAIVRSSGS